MRSSARFFETLWIDSCGSPLPQATTGINTSDFKQAPYAPLHEGEEALPTPTIKDAECFDVSDACTDDKKPLDSEIRATALSSITQIHTDTPPTAPSSGEGVISRTRRGMIGTRAVAALMVVATAFTPTVLTPSTADARVTALAEEHLEQLSEEGAKILKNKIKHVRLMISVGTPATDKQIVLSMCQARRLGWSPMIAVRLPRGTPPPSMKNYEAWLTGFLTTYPQIEAVETNEPELTGISAPRAVAQYRATKRAINKAAPRRTKGAVTADRVLGEVCTQQYKPGVWQPKLRPQVKVPDVTALAGGISDSDKPGNEAYIKRYVKLLHEPNAVWALHFYKAVIRSGYEGGTDKHADKRIKPDSTYDLVQERIKLVGAKKYWITETGVFGKLKNVTYTYAQQFRQARFVRKISNDKRAVRTYYMGGESCVGCTSSFKTTPISTSSSGPAPQYDLNPPPVPLPPDNGIVWKTHLFENREGKLSESTAFNQIFHP